jgi:hypothetical protein
LVFFFFFFYSLLVRPRYQKVSWAALYAITAGY